MRPNDRKEHLQIISEGLYALQDKLSGGEPDLGEARRLLGVMHSLLRSVQSRSYPPVEQLNPGDMVVAVADLEYAGIRAGAFGVVYKREDAPDQTWVRWGDGRTCRISDGAVEYLG